MNEAKFSSMIHHRVIAKSLRMKELNSLRLQSRHAWRYPESETSRIKLRINPMSSTKLFQIFLLTLCWTLRTVSGQGTAIPLSDGDIQQIVDAHNLFRGMVEPPASNMQRIEWNSELAMVAQNYAETCMFNPNPDRAAQAPSFETVGENRAFGRTTNYTDLIERGWFVVQRNNFDFDSNMCLSPGACDEYIQLVWAESNLVGCGAANCPTVTGLPILPNAVVFVCNYAPEGNIPGRLPYEAGPPCSQCPQGMDFCVENTCSSVGTLPPLTTTTQAPEPPTTTQPPMTTQPDAVDTTAATTQAAITSTEEQATSTTEEHQPATTPPTSPPATTSTVATTPEPPETTVEVQTTTPTSPCPPTVSPPIIVTIKPPRPTKKPVTPTTKRPITSWYLIWLTIIKHKQTSYTVWPWPTLKPDRTGTRSRKSRGSRRRNSRFETRTRKKSKSEDSSSSSSSSKSSTGTRRSKSKCTKSKKRKKTRKMKTRRMRGRG